MIILVGFMGAGKTTVGRLLAERLGVAFVDSDAVIEQRERRPIRAIFAEVGERGFRDIEERTIRELLEGPPCVLSLGGGACGREGTRRALGAHTVVHLHVGLDEALSRVGRDADRPLLRHDDLPGLYAERLDRYRDTADVACDTTGRGVEDVVLEIVERIAGITGTTDLAGR